MHLIKSNKIISLNEINKNLQSELCDLNFLIENKVFKIPDFSKDIINDRKFFKNNILFHGESPILFDKLILSSLKDREIKLKYHQNSVLQYYLLSQIKGKSEINSSPEINSTKKHHWRMREFCKKLQGDLLLDIGCDKPSLSHLLYPANFKYVGLDPSFSNEEFKIIGMAEMLPFSNESFDVVSFNGSLDHILDYYSAIDEASRVLKSRGKIVLSGYAWIKNATLLTDDVHFHHFRDHQLFSVLDKDFKIERVFRYEDPKNQDHRYGIYIEAKKN